MQHSKIMKDHYFSVVGSAQAPSTDGLSVPSTASESPPSDILRSDVAETMLGSIMMFPNAFLRFRHPPKHCV